MKKNMFLPLAAGLITASLGLEAADLTMAQTPGAAAPDALNLPDPAPTIIPNGMMSLFGKPQVLFKVFSAYGGQPGSSPREYILAEGEQVDAIKVIQIDMRDGSVLFDNGGEIQRMTLAGAGGSDRKMPSATTAPQEAGGANTVPVHGNDPDPSQAGAPGLPIIPPGFPLAVGTADPAGTDSLSQNSAPLTPEAQAVLMEIQRRKLIQREDPQAALIPPALGSSTTLFPGPVLASGASTQDPNH